jgi:hypothetical protein
LREQINLNEHNYLNPKIDFWLNIFFQFNTCPFSTGKLNSFLIALHQNQLVDRGREQFGISILDVEWELTINYETLIVKIAPDVNFKTLDSFLYKNNYSQKEQEGIVYYHLPKELLIDYEPATPTSFSKSTMKQISTIYIDPDEKIIIIGYSIADILPSIKAHQSKIPNKNFDILDWNLLDLNFKDNFTLLVSNRQNKIKSHWVPGLNIDTVCKERLDISYEELKSLHPIPLRVMGINSSTKTAQIMTVYITSEQAKQDQKLREHLVLNSNSFMTTKPTRWNGLYLNYVDNKVTKNCLTYNFTTPEEGCFYSIVIRRDFPFLIAPPSTHLFK